MKPQEAGMTREGHSLETNMIDQNDKYISIKATTFFIGFFGCLIEIQTN